MSTSKRHLTFKLCTAGLQTLFQKPSVQHKPHPIPCAVSRGKKQAASVSAPILTALNLAASSMPAVVSISPASPSTPDVPPDSSLTSFLRQSPQTPGLVLTDFDAAFSNPYFQSSYDDVGNIDPDAIADVATLVARALLELAGGKPLTSSAPPTANPGFVKDLIGCLLTPYPGLSCNLVQNLTTPLTASGFANHYVGILQEGPGPNPFPLDDTSRFLWNLLANVTGRTVNGSACDGVCPAGQACVGWTAAKKGTCLNATARYGLLGLVESCLRAVPSCLSAAIPQSAC